MSAEPSLQNGLAFLKTRREEDLASVLAGRAPRTDSTPDLERELLLAALHLASGDETRFSRAVQSATLSGAAPERILDLLLLSVPVIGPERADRAADLVRKFFGEPSGEESWRLAALLDEIKDGSGKEVKVGGLEIALLRRGAVIHAVQAACPHRRGSLADGFATDTTITCALHAWTFDLATGVCEGIPGARVSVFQTKIEGNRVFVRA